MSQSSAAGRYGLLVESPIRPSQPECRAGTARRSQQHLLSGHTFHEINKPQPPEWQHDFRFQTGRLAPHRYQNALVNRPSRHKTHEVNQLAESRANRLVDFMSRDA
jgi:hypothetical protein